MRIIESNLTLEEILFKPNGISFHNWKSVLIVFFSLLITFTTMGNLVTLIAAIKMKEFHNSVSNLYIASLAGADLIIGSFIVTFRVLYLVGFDGVWVFGDWLCDTWQILDFACCSISLYSICAIAFDRWFNLQKPLRIFKRSRSFAKKSILVIWIMPLVISITAFSTIGGRNADTKQCCFYWENITLVPVFVIPVFYIPVLLLLIFFLRIAYVIRNHFHFLQKHANSDKSKPRRKITEDPITTASKRSPNPNSMPAYLSHRASFSACSLLAQSQTVTSPGTLLASKGYSNGFSYDSVFGEDVCSTVIPNSNAPVSGKGGRTSRNGYKFSQPCLPTGYLKKELDQLQRQQMFKSEKSTSLRDSIDRNLQTPKSEATPNKSLFSLGEFSDEHAIPLSPKMGQARRLRKFYSRQRSVPECSIFSKPSDLALMKKINGRLCAATVLPVRSPSPVHRAKTETELLTGKGVNRISSKSEHEFIPYVSAGRRFSTNLFSEILPNATIGIGQQMRAARAVGVIMICFLVCWLPFITIWPIKITCPDCVSDKVYDSAIWLNYLNSTINPVLYALCSPRFQMCIKRYFSLTRRRSNNTSIGRGMSKL